MEIKPGRGWKYIGGAVYEHESGARVHMLGVVKLPNGVFMNENKWPESKTAWTFIRANGGNRKRGLMAWARRMLNQDLPNNSAAPLDTATKLG